MIKNENLIVAKCIDCDAQFTEEQIKGKNSCPNCNSTSVPTNPQNDVQITINTHELRILTLWADNWACVTDDKNLDNAYHKSLKSTLQKICNRIRKQLPKNKLVPLTWADEMEDIKNAGICENVQLFIGGKEQI